MLVIRGGKEVWYRRGFSLAQAAIGSGAAPVVESDADFG